MITASIVGTIVALAALAIAGLATFVFLIATANASLDKLEELHDWGIAPPTTAPERPETEVEPTDTTAARVISHPTVLPHQ